MKNSNSNNRLRVLSLQGVSRSFTTEPPTRVPVQFVIDQIQHGIGRFRILSATPIS